MGIVKNEKLALKAIGNCHIHYVPAAEAKEQIEKTVSIDPTQFGGEAPADGFYYDGK